MTEQVISWTPARVETLTKLYQDGLTMGQIAKELGYGHARNAVIGKIHRLKLTRRPSTTLADNREAKHGNTGQPKPQKIYDKAQRAKAERAKVEAIMPEQRPRQPMPEPRAWDALPGTSPVPLEKRTGCKWPIGEASPFLFCNEPAGEKGRYCPHHEERSRSKL